MRVYFPDWQNPKRSSTPEKETHMRRGSSLTNFENFTKHQDRLAAMCFDERMAEAMERRAILASRKITTRKDDDLPPGFIPVKKTARPLYA
jgi:hypothetical protein